MPTLSGPEATKIIRNLKIHQPIIIAVTANVMQGDRDACLADGMDDFISKPWKVADVKRCIEKFFGIKV